MIAFRIAGIPVYYDKEEASGRELISYSAGLMIDADGDPRAYHPDGVSGLDSLSSAGYPRGGWRNILAVDQNDNAYVQKYGDPAPGFFVSMTTYRHKPNGMRIPQTDPRSWVDAGKVPYVVVPPQVRMLPAGIVLGCKVIVKYRDKVVQAVVADIGPRTKIGEGSIALAKALGIKDSPRNGGLEDKGVLYYIYPNVPAEVNGVTYQLTRA